MSRDRRTGFKDINGEWILIGDTLRTKWGGIGVVVEEIPEVLIAFEGGEVKVVLDENSIENRGLTKVEGDNR